ncbi:gamma-glutamyl-gamma-aminobutyrate hydrolase family protein [Oscillibacter sp.]|uniref:gamma-glutamyl-gamma-aminobutyrate hydrolase family protein n=1 Tax=Oscillibacter sp. TaxID=1945593 RepID=UPI00257F62BE|nr:gamma-glutamyl-gamma-aminobutyrate hydrolase family protein [Oscillibacter sp.]
MPGTAGAERVFGGTLIQDLPGHSQAAGRDRLHRVRTAPSPLQDLFGETLVVNSAHHQAADRLGQGLRAVQWAIDGTVEAVIHQSLPVWGVQWHPERLAALIPVRSRRWRVPFHRLAGAGWWHRTILEKNCGFPLDRWACPW